MCDRVKRWFMLKESEAAVNLLAFLNFRHYDGVPFQRKQRSCRGDRFITSD